MTTTPSSDQALPERFEDAIAELEAVVAAMESGKLSLEASLAHYQRGSHLMQHCRQALTHAEQRIAVLEAEQLHAFTPTDPA